MTKSSTAHDVRCPKCGAIQVDLALDNDALKAGQVRVLGFVCIRCGKVVHWGIRKKERKAN